MKKKKMIDGNKSIVQQSVIDAPSSSSPAEFLSLSLSLSQFTRR
jgi:hypothetical protein